MSTTGLSLLAGRTAQPPTARRRQRWLSATLGVWWWAIALVPVGAQMPPRAVEVPASRGLGFVVNGSNASDSSGWSVSNAGDVNGDGIPDLIVGAPFAAPDSRSSAGRSYVVFGKRNGRPVELAAIDISITRGGFTINGSNAEDLSGFSVSGAGDVNGDGLADVILGAFRADPSGRSSAGRSYVVFGKGDNQPVELAAIESGTSSAGFVLNGSNTNDQSGYSVSGAGDVNGDGLADLIVGAPFANPNTGRSYVVFGKGDNQPIELAAVESGTSAAGFVLNGSTYDRSGFSVSGAGDVNGDGLADLIVGAPFANPNGQYSAGRSYVVFGKGDNQPVELTAIESGTSAAGFVLNGSSAGDQSGRSVSGAGDVNGDRLDDLIVGARNADPDGRSNAGRSYVVFGKRDNQPIELATLESGTSAAGFVLNGSNERNYSGDSVSGAGDVNGDKLDDLIVGAFLLDSDGRSYAGRGYVVFGKRNTQPVELASIDLGTGREGFFINISNGTDSYGFRSVSNAGDVNGDGLADLILGARRSTSDGEYGAGRDYVVFGKRNTQPVELADISSGASPAGFAINGSNAADLAGFPVSGAGDVNGDGLADVIVGVFYADPDGRSRAGRSYVVFGKRNGQSVQLADIESGTGRDGFVLNGSNAGDDSGYSVSGAGDVNGDGLADVIVGARGADPDGRSSAGRSYVVFGKRNAQPVELTDLEDSRQNP